MIPCLYDISETEYTTNGIGKLADCISCIVTEKRNGSYELEMEYPVDGIHAEAISEGAIIYAKPADNKSSQAFRIYKITTPMDGILEVSARHISYQLNFITVSPLTLSSGTADQPALAFAALQESASTDCPFSFVTDVASEAKFAISEPTSFRNALGGIDGSMLDTFGGEFEWDMYTVNLWKSRGSDNGVRIVYGKNLVDFTMEKSIENTITGVHPFWEDAETGDVMELPEKIVTLAESDFPFDKIVTLDCSDQFEEQPSEDDLRAYAQAYLTTTDYIEPDIDINIDFAQLWQMPGYEDIAEAERVSLCDTVHVYVSKLGIEVSAKVTETEYDVLLERYKSITLSNSTSSSRNTSLALTLSQELDELTANIKSGILKVTAIANGKTTTYYATEAPEGTSYTINDIWFDTDDGYAMYYWTGEKWTKAPYGTNAIGEGVITTELLAAECVTAGKISVDELSAISANLGKITGGSLNIGNGTFTVDSEGHLAAASAVLSGTLVTESGDIKTQIESGRITVYYDGVATGKLISSHRTSDSTKHGVTLAALDLYLSLDYDNIDDDDDTETTTAYLLNNGLNPNDHTERHIFHDAAYFDSNIHFANNQGIQIADASGTESDMMFFNGSDNLMIGNINYVNDIFLRAKGDIYIARGGSSTAYREPEIEAGYASATLNSTSGQIDVTFDRTFSSTPYVVLTVKYNSSTAVTAWVRTVSTTGFTLQYTTEKTGITPQFEYIAVY